MTDMLDVKGAKKVATVQVPLSQQAVKNAKDTSIIGDEHFTQAVAMVQELMDRSDAIQDVIDENATVVAHITGQDIELENKAAAGRAVTGTC